MIPPLLFRVVGQEVAHDSRCFWDRAAELHPDWQLVTYQDPLDAAEWPLTADQWSSCTSGAQLAGLLRLEALLRHGGVYIDSDVELYRPLDPLLSLRAFAGWEDRDVVPDAVLGAEADHPAIRRCLDLALARIASESEDWRIGRGAWATGPGVTTEVLPDRDDVLVLPPGSFFPVHYTEKARLASYTPEPWVFGLHHWHGSWLDG